MFNCLLPSTRPKHGYKHLCILCLLLHLPNRLYILKYSLGSGAQRGCYSINICIHTETPRIVFILFIKQLFRPLVGPWCLHKQKAFSGIRSCIPAIQVPCRQCSRTHARTHSCPSNPAWLCRCGCSAVPSNSQIPSASEDTSNTSWKLTTPLTHSSPTHPITSSHTTS